MARQNRISFSIRTTIVRCVYFFASHRGRIRRVHSLFLLFFFFFFFFFSSSLHQYCTLFVYSLFVLMFTSAQPTQSYACARSRLSQKNDKENIKKSREEKFTSFFFSLIYVRARVCALSLSPFIMASMYSTSHFSIEHQ